VRLISTNADSLRGLFSPYVVSIKERIKYGIDSIYPGLLDLDDEQSQVNQKSKEEPQLTIENVFAGNQPDSSVQVYECSPPVEPHNVFVSPMVEYDAKGHRKYHGFTRIYRSSEHEESHRKRKRRKERLKTLKNGILSQELQARYSSFDVELDDEAECRLMSWKDIDQSLEITSLESDRFTRSSKDTIAYMELEQGFNYEVDSNPDRDRDSGCDLAKQKPSPKIRMTLDVGGPSMEERRLSDMSNRSKSRMCNLIQEEPHGRFSFDMAGAKLKSSTLPSNLLHHVKDLQSYKSRASLLSSLEADTPSDILVRFSYFSKSSLGSAPSEETFDFDHFDGNSMVTTVDYKTVTVPISLSLTIMFMYILLGAFLFGLWEDNDMLKWSYFCFITLSTIGFGDILPGTNVSSGSKGDTREKLAISSIYVGIGLSVFAMCIKLMQEEVVAKLKWLAQRIKLVTSKETEEEE
ncbi:hypothetical protein Ciccas_012541, partial [Cichlidogyrus casuarinus]